MYTSVLKRGNLIYFSGYDAHGVRVREKRSFEPTFYVESTSPNAKFRDMHESVTLDPIHFKDINSAQQWSESMKDARPIYGMEKYNFQYINRHYSDTTKFNHDMVHTAILDIEVDSPDEFPEPREAKYELNAIAIWSTRNKKYYGLYLKGWDQSKSEKFRDIDIDFQQYDTEQELLTQLLNLWRDLDFDIVTGWNSEKFDIPYIYVRMCNVIGPSVARQLSPFNIVNTRDAEDKWGNKVLYVNLFGLNQIDYLDLYQKYTFKPHENYKLNTIAYDEGVGEKIDYSEHKSLANLYNRDPQKFMDYNIQDVALIKALDDKLFLLNLALDIAYFSGINPEDVFSPIKIWDTIIYRHLRQQNIIIPFFKHNAARSYPGGHVKPPLPRNSLYGWIVSFDLASLYPSVIRQWNIGPETIRKEYSKIDYSEENCERKYIKTHNKQYGIPEGHCLAGNGAVFSTDKQSFLSELMEWLYTERKAVKKRGFAHDKVGEKELAKKCDTRQHALKVLLNSAYGALGSQWFRFYDVDLASAVTLSGQIAIKHIAKEINTFFVEGMGMTDIDRVIAIDTDSVYLNIEDIVKHPHFAGLSEEETVDAIDKFCKKMERTVIQPAYDKLCEWHQCREQVMFMDREAIASSGFWRAKKAYALRVLDMEGKRKEILKIMGLETQRGTTPEVFKKSLKRAIEIILREKDNDKLIDFIDEFREEMKKLDYDDVSSAKRATSIDKYKDRDTLWRKGTPGHVRGALVYNYQIQRNNLEHEYPLAKNGDILNILYLKPMNPFGSTMFCYPDYFPRDIGIEKYIDWDLQFEKLFLHPLRGMCDCINFNTKHVASLAGLFS